METIDKAVKRSGAYWFVDGIVEIYIGGLLLFLGLLNAVQVWVPASVSGFFGFAVPLVMMVGAILGGFAVHVAKSRLTYPRTGYVVYPQQSRSQKIWTAILGAIFGVLFAVLFINLSDTRLVGYLPVAVGSFFAFFLYVVSRRFGGITRLYWLAALSVLAGGVQTWLWGGDLTGNAFYNVVMGLALLASGALTLRSYLQHAPPAKPGE